ncbi:hypothetical protein [Sphingomonas bacterium]|uniref:hypothetical protein n=1 Tax=Sphingomonas bacterium TaxID=1895847 RepID=UPI001574F6B7|nr:hypothetical protein [Sphingomonas bacterium]
MIRARSFRTIEQALALAVVAGAAWSVGHLLVRGWLPQPFYPDPADYWMDWFHTAWWSRHDGAYDRWRTLYPPVSFMLLRALSLPRCYLDGNDAAVRGCDWVGTIALHGWYVLDVLLIAATFTVQDRRTAVPRAVALTLGLPMLNALDRGNLILVCLACFVLAHGPLLRGVRSRSLALGLTINLKVYLIATAFAVLPHGRWRVFGGALLATGGVYLLSWACWGAGDPVALAGNLIGWSVHLREVTSLWDIWYSTAYGPVVAALNGSLVPLGPGWTRGLAAVIPPVVHGVQVLILVAAVVAARQPATVSPQRLLNLATLIALVTSDGGGYAQVLTIFLTFSERPRGIGVRVALIVGYLLSVPVDLGLVHIVTRAAGDGVHAGPIVADYWLTLGQLLRPAGVLVLASALSCATIHDVWRADRAASPGRRAKNRGVQAVTKPD